MLYLIGSIPTKLEKKVKYKIGLRFSYFKYFLYLCALLETLDFLGGADTAGLVNSVGLSDGFNIIFVNN